MVDLYADSSWFTKELSGNREEVEQCLEDYRRVRVQRNSLMVRAYEVWLDPDLPSMGLGVTALSEVTGLSRQAVYAVVSRQGSEASQAAARLERGGQLSI